MKTHLTFHTCRTDGFTKRSCAALVTLLLSASSTAFAGGVGTTAANILQIPVGARAMAMGEAYVAQADDVSSLYWNPAGLAILPQAEASFMYNQSFQDMGYSYGAVGVPLENGGIGGSLSYLSFGKINGYDTAGQPIGNVNAYSGVGTVGGAYLGDFWSAGMSLQGVQGSLADVKATGFATDLGLNLIYPKEVLNGTVRFGATVRHLGTGLKYLQNNDPFPTEFRAGLAAVQMINRRLNLSLDYGKARDAKGNVYAGGEYWLSILALRVGYAGSDAEGSGLRAGVGIKIKDFSFDYAYSQYGDLGMAHRYELTYRFGNIRPLLTPEERRILRRGKLALRQGRYSEAVLLFNSLIDLEPGYIPARRLIKLAMKGSDQDDREAKNTRKFDLNTLHKAQPTHDDGDDQQELETLLNLGQNDTKAAQATPEKR